MNPDNEPQFHLINNKKPSSKWKVIWSVLGIVLLTALATFAYLWWQERQSNGSLRTQLTAAKEENQKKAATADVPTPKPQATYSATVGKFTLTLAKNYFIIVDLDGEFEGGPATRLAIGTKNALGEQTINSASHARITVDAYPAVTESYTSRVANETADYPEKKKLPNVKVAGVDAEVYELPGLFTDKKLFFTKNNIIYVMTAHHSDTVQNALDDVVAGFKFN